VSVSEDFYAIMLERHGKWYRTVIDDRPVDGMVTLTPLPELPPDFPAKYDKVQVPYHAAARYAQKDGG